MDSILSYVIFVATAIILSGTLGLLLVLDERAQIAPDSEYYLALARGERVPRPFCFRPAVPWFIGSNFAEWKVITLASVVAQGLAIALITNDLRAVILLLALPGGARFSLRCPVLVDAVAMLAVLCATIVAGQVHWSVLIILGIILATFRESAPVWFAVYSRSMYPLLGVPATLFALSLLFGRKPEVGRDNAFIRNPIGSCLAHRHGRFFDWKLLLLPWGVLLPLALLGDWRIAGAVWALSAAPLLAVTDTARVQYWAAPALIPLALAAPIPELWWPLLLAVHVFNPYRGA